MTTHLSEWHAMLYRLKTSGTCSTQQTMCCAVSGCMCCNKKNKIIRMERDVPADHVLASACIYASGRPRTGARKSPHATPDLGSHPKSNERCCNHPGRWWSMPHRACCDREEHMHGRRHMLCLQPIKAIKQRHWICVC